MNHREIMSRLNTAFSNIDFAYAIIAKKYGLTYNALMVLYLIEDSGDITQKNICDALYLPKSTVHSIILEFIKEGYICLETRSNKKKKYVVVTTVGKAYIKEIIQEIYRIEENVLCTLGDDTCNFLTQTVEKLGNLMKKEINKLYDSEV